MTAQDEVGAKLKSFFGASAAGLANQLGSTRRAAAGLLAIAVLLAGYGLLVLSDTFDGLRAAYAQEMLRLHRLAATERETDWPARAAASAERRASLEKRLWAAESEGSALADLQDWVTRTGREVGIEKLQVRVEGATPKGMPADIRQLTATVSAPQTEDNVVQLLARIASEPRLLVVDRLHVEQRPVPIFEMSLVAYAKLVDRTGGKDRATPR